MYILHTYVYCIYIYIKSHVCFCIHRLQILALHRDEEEIKSTKLKFQKQ